MFFKEVRDKNKTPGKVYVYYMLVRSFRDEQGVSRDKVLLNAGKLPYSRDTLRRLAQRVEEILAGQLSLQSGLPPELEKKAHELATRVLQRQLKLIGPTREVPPEVLSFDPRNLNVEDARSIAGEQLLSTVAHRIGLIEALQRAGLGKRRSKLAAALTMGRALNPSPLPELVRWLVQQSGMDEVLGTSLDALSAPEAARTTRWLARHSETVCSGLNDQPATADPRALAVLDLRHCVPGSSSDSWILGLKLEPVPQLRTPLIFRLDGKKALRAVRAALDLHTFADETRRPFLILDARCRPLLKLAEDSSYHYVILGHSPRHVARALQTPGSASWQAFDGQWILAAPAALPNGAPHPAQVRSSASDHVLLRTNIRNADRDHLASLLTNLAEMDRDLLAVQPAFRQQAAELPTPQEGEFFLTFLALRLVRALVSQLTNGQRARSWAALREFFGSQARVTLRLPDPFGSHTRFIRTTTQPGRELAALYEEFGIRPDLLGDRYFTV